MKRFTLLAALGLCSISLFAQDAQKEEPKEEGFVFTTVKELPITSVKNQRDVYKRQAILLREGFLTDRLCVFYLYIN